MRRYSDAQLISAVSGSHSWRGVLRTLGLTATSGSSMRLVRAHAERLGLDHSHFRGQRRWTDAQLANAVASAGRWAEVQDSLGLIGGSSLGTIRGHALRLGLDTTHLSSSIPESTVGQSSEPKLANLRRAGSLMAAAWFELCGDSVAWPFEPCRYDLLVWRESAAERIQVKTTTLRSGTTWAARITNGSGEPAPYDPDEIDQFFVIDGDLTYYLIPVAAVGGLTTIRVSAYQRYRLPTIPAGTVESEPCLS